MADSIHRLRPLSAGISSLHHPSAPQKSNTIPSKFEIQLKPQDIIKSLGGVLQEHDLSYKERKKVFQEVVKKVIQNPTNPYSKLGQHIQEDMVNQISTVLADSHLKAPKLS